MASYKSRIEVHKLRYETMCTSGGPFVKIFNVGERLVVHNVQGYVCSSLSVQRDFILMTSWRRYLQSRIVFYLMNIHNRYRTIWFARTGQSLLEHSYKADSDLSPEGKEYSDALREFIVKQRRELQDERTKNGDDFEERPLSVRCPASTSLSILYR